MAWQRVASISEIDADGVLGVDVDGSPVALYRLGNEVFATAGICTHALALLSDGFVEDGKIECPLHQGQFDIRSGKALCAPVTEGLRTYAVKLDGNDVCIDMERPAAPCRCRRRSRRVSRCRCGDLPSPAHTTPFQSECRIGLDVADTRSCRP